jgi:hypothetical protein
MTHSIVVRFRPAGGLPVDRNGEALGHLVGAAADVTRGDSHSSGMTVVAAFSQGATSQGEQGPLGITRRHPQPQVSGFESRFPFDSQAGSAGSIPLAVLARGQPPEPDVRGSAPTPPAGCCPGTPQQLRQVSATVSRHPQRPATGFYADLSARSLATRASMSSRAWCERIGSM